ncbi:MAG: HEAT repeat domain-containing protein [Acidimicrobiales bacterium]
MSRHDLLALHDPQGLPAARRKGAAAAAGHLNDQPAARGALADEDEGVRAAALGAVLRLGALTVADLEQAFADPSPTVRRRAAELAWRSSCQRSEVIALVARLLEDAESEVVEAACFCLGELQPPDMTGVLSEVATGHADPLCRESAVAALGAIGNQGALRAILVSLDDRPPIRRRAVLALASYEGPEVDSALARALEDRDWQVRQAAEDVIGVRPAVG